MAPPHAPAAAGQRGYALIALLVILGTGLLYYLVRQMEQPAVAARHGEASLKAMSLAKQALLGYAATYRDSHANEMFGHLPCPDTDGDGIADRWRNGDPGVGRATTSAVRKIPRS